MIFVSNKGLNIGFRAPVIAFTPKGDPMGKRPRVHAQFARGGCPEWAVKFALENLNWHDIPDVPPQMRLWSWDSVQAQRDLNWNDEEREAIEQWMIMRLETGQSTDFMLADKQPVPPPWPTYDQTEEARISKMVEELGLNPQLVVDYELDNASRLSVLDAMGVLLSKEPESEELVVQA